MKKFPPILCVVLFTMTLQSQARELLIKYGSNWHYHNGEGEFDPTWKDPDFDESTWENGAAPFIYGHYRGNTIVQHNQRPRPITTYYRTNFNLKDPESVEFIEFLIRADDGMALYLNGQRCFWIFMPDTGPYTPEMVSTDYISKYRPSTYGRLAQRFMPLLKKGQNTIAVEVHQNQEKSSDLLMDMEMSFAKKGTQKEAVFEEGSEWAYYDKRELPDSDWWCKSLSVKASYEAKSRHKAADGA